GLQILRPELRRSPEPQPHHLPGLRQDRRVRERKDRKAGERNQPQAGLRIKNAAPADFRPVRGIEKARRVQEEGLLGMGDPLDPAKRPSRLPWFIHIAVVLLLSFSFISGLLVWQGLRLQAQAMETPAWLHG